MRRRWALAVAAAAVLLAAVDTYVIVLELPSIMSDVGVGLERLQAGTPIMSGFLLGYIVVMPVLGRLSGGALLAVSTWRTIFWLNLPLGAMLAVGILLSSRRARPVAASSRPFRGHDLVGAGLATAAVVAGALAVVAPDPLRDDATLGTLYVPIGSTWLTPLSLAALVAAIGFCAWELRAQT